MVATIGTGEAFDRGRDFAVWLKKELARLGAQDPKELALQVVLLVEGCPSMILIHGDRSYAAAAANAARRLASGNKGG